ncbi:MAG: hypothetical protein ACFFBH_02135 [Promethearchaeota archaeon]
MKAGKLLTIIAASIAVVSILLGLIAPQYFGWYRIEGYTGDSLVVGLYTTGFGTIVTMPPGYVPFQIMNLTLVSGIVLIIGAILCINGALVEKRTLINIGGILIIITPLLSLIDVQLVSGNFYINVLDILGGPEFGTLIWGSYTIGPGSVLIWGIWIGAFIAFGAGILALVGAGLKLK